METVLSNDEIRRYSRHLIMPEVTLEGQKRLKEASVLCIGAGGLGSPLTIYLTAAGVGRIGLVDFDRVEFSNLQRQILHHTGDVGRPKLESAAEKLIAINPEVEVVTHEELFTSANAVRICQDYDVVADGTDNFPTRYLANDVCVLLGKPNVYASVFRFEGQASVFHAGKGPCYRCLYPEPPPPGMVPSCAEGGVLGVLPGVMGTIQATEVIKLILGIGESLIGRLLLFDALEMRSTEMQLQKDPDCPMCGVHPTIHELIDYEAFCGLPVGGEESHAEELGAEWEITPRELQARNERDSHQPFIVDVREPHEWDICHLPEAHLIPEGDLSARMHELDSADEIVLYCRTGVRSARALKLLREAGFSKLKNLVGGIHEWADEVDSSMPTY
jgi:adenylyltransferase/sulfurtransferase